MASKTHLLIFLSIAIMATSIADAQLLSVRLGVSGIVNCTLNSTVGVPARPFPNATVLLQCPPGTTIATAITNSLGGFNLNVTVTPILLNSLGNFRVVVNTSLANCNASLPPTGSLVSTGLALVGISLNGTIITISLRLLNLVFIAAGIGK